MKTSNKRKSIDLSGEGSDDQGGCGEAPSDNREGVIERAKKHLLNATNIESSPDEMQCLDSFLFRCWQMGWLREYDNEKPAYEEMMEVLSDVKDAFETDVIWAPGASPTYKQVEKVRKVYKDVCDALDNRELQDRRYREGVAIVSALREKAGWCHNNNGNRPFEDWERMCKWLLEMADMLEYGLGYRRISE